MATISCSAMPATTISRAAPTTTRSSAELGSDALNGGIGIDTASYAGAGSSVFVFLANPAANTGEAAGDTYSSIENLVGSAFGNSLNGNTGANKIVGGNGNDQLFGDTGNDTLEGGAGGDNLVGGDGIDTASYQAATSDVWANLSDPAKNFFGEGVGDLYNSIENLTGSSYNDRLTGNTSSNILSSNDGNDILNGREGTDTMIGGTGHDTYYVDNAGDSVVELADAGTDWVAVTFSYTLGPNLEKLVFIVAGDMDGTGNELDNALHGNGYTNVLTGGGGNDALYGENGDDQLWGGVGNDFLDGSFGTDILNGESGNDTLSGGLDADTLQGGDGDDTYVLADGTDTVNDTAGIDTITSTITRSLASFALIENLTLLGTAAVNGTGNELANTVIGNANANILNGGGGIDSLQGLGGNDTYVVEQAGDVVIEAASEGTDLVRANITHTLAANVENLDLLGANAINGLGNALGNTINGNSAANSLLGRAGNDVLTGGDGRDGFFFTSALNAATNVDRIMDFNVPDDTIRLDDAFFTGFGAVGPINADAFHIGAAAADAEDRIIYNSANGALTFDTNGNAAGGATQFATLGTGLALTNADFLVF